MNGSIAWPTAHPEEWLWMHHEVRVEAQRAGKTHYHILIAQGIEDGN